MQDDLPIAATFSMYDEIDEAIRDQQWTQEPEGAAFLEPDSDEDERHASPVLLRPLPQLESDNYLTLAAPELLIAVTPLVRHLFTAGPGEVIAAPELPVLEPDGHD